MSTMTRVWKGSGFNKEVRLFQYQYDDGSIHYTFYPRVGTPANPTQEEADRIIKTWKLEEVKI